MRSGWRFGSGCCPPAPQPFCLLCGSEPALGLACNNPFPSKPQGSSFSHSSIPLPAAAWAPCMGMVQNSLPQSSTNCHQPPHKWQESRLPALKEPLTLCFSQQPTTHASLQNFLFDRCSCLHFSSPLLWHCCFKGGEQGVATGCASHDVSSSYCPEEWDLCLRNGEPGPHFSQLSLQENLSSGITTEFLTAVCILYWWKL